MWTNFFHCLDFTDLDWLYQLERKGNTPPHQSFLHHGRSLARTCITHLAKQVHYPGKLLYQPWDDTVGYQVTAYLWWCWIIHSLSTICSPCLGMKVLFAEASLFLCSWCVNTPLLPLLASRSCSWHWLFLLAVAFNMLFFGICVHCASWYSVEIIQDCLITSPSLSVLPCQGLQPQFSLKTHLHPLMWAVPTMTVIPAWHSHSYWSNLVWSQGVTTVMFVCFAFQPLTVFSFIHFIFLLCFLFQKSLVTQVGLFWKMGPLSVY